MYLRGKSDQGQLLAVLFTIRASVVHDMLKLDSALMGWRVVQARLT